MQNLELYKRRKKELGLTFEDLSKRCGVPIQTLHNIFRGHTVNPRIDTLRAINLALGIEEGIDAAPKIEEKENGQNEREKRLLAAFDALIPPMQEYVSEMVEKLVSQGGAAARRA